MAPGNPSNPRAGLSTRKVMETQWLLLTLQQAPQPRTARLCRLVERTSPTRVASYAQDTVSISSEYEVASKLTCRSMDTNHTRNERQLRTYLVPWTPKRLQGWIRWQDLPKRGSSKFVLSDIFLLDDLAG